MMLFLTLQAYFLQEPFYLIIVMLPEIILVAFDFNIQLLNSRLLGFFRFYFQFSRVIHFDII